jgi:DNA-3-methyladenine glycosylase
MYGLPGLSYVYFTYGMHHCVNVGAAALGVPEAVLIRALEPVDGIETMRANRARASKSPRSIADRDLCRGPAKLCYALLLNRAHSGLDLTSSPILWIEPRRARKTPRIITAPRIGIDRVPEPWRSAPLRYLSAGNPCVSRPPKAKNP